MKQLSTPTGIVEASAMPLEMGSMIEVAEGMSYQGWSRDLDFERVGSDSSKSIAIMILALDLDGLGWFGCR